MTAAPDWRGSLKEILSGIDQELDGPESGTAVLEDLKVMLDNTRNVIQAYGSTNSTAEYLKKLRELRLRRAVDVCRNVLADIRAGHVLGAVNIAVMLANPAGPGMIPNLEFAGQVAERFPPESKLITACLRGGRSLRAAQVLVAEGFTDVVDMRGGYDGELDAAGNVVFPGWARRGLPTTTDS